MGFGDTTLLCKIVFGLLITCFVIDLIGFAIPYWHSTDSVFGLKNFGGLWDDCHYLDGDKKCENIKENVLPESFLSWFRAVRAFSILSWLFFLAALVIVIIFMFFMSAKKPLYLVAVCLSFAGAFCALIAFAVYAGESFSSYTHYHIAFALTVVSFVLGLLAGILGILDYFLGGGGK
ncbi:hypothetical protein CHS0354_039767 [Potamilus streckersoni]|uniref:Uncharacterized protein n=1 Tax=Potamilus streckersoni TaxID=2493646 RepID=A0AAE0RZT2_9BIVA|nr:hypothetical protein CHS0354_039767 [Potamilus streckersoni]